MTQLPKPETQDTTIADIHRIRRRISEAFGGDIHAITEDARKRQEQSGRKTVSFSRSPDEASKTIEDKPAS